ncbi:MAG: phosphatidate cytidylyltransferase [Actinomycetota bacterium]
MSDDSNDFEGFHIVEGDAADDEFAAPGRSVFGDDDFSFEEDDDAIPHWSEPPTGAVPQVGGDTGAITFDPTPEPSLREAEPDELAAWAEVSSTPMWADDEPAAEPAPAVQVGGVSDAADDFFGFEDEPRPSRLGPAPVGSTPIAEPVAEEQQTLGASLGQVAGASGERDMPMAIIVGVFLAGLFLAAMAVGPVAALAVVTIALTLAAVEFYNAVRVAGYQPAVLLGLTAVLTMPLAVYWRGEAAIGLVLVLSIVFGSLWYVMGISPDGAMRGLGATILGVVHIGVLGSFAALMLTVETHGTGMLTAAVILTVAYDVGGLAIGRVMGRTPLSPASPNKTVEGLMGGMAMVIVAAAVMGVLGQPSPIAGETFEGSGIVAMIIVGIAAALAAPIGDLAESQIKRDLGIKDMGTILPGHGGLLDRFDGLLFVLPTVWYVTNALVFT